MKRNLIFKIKTNYFYFVMFCITILSGYLGCATTVEIKLPAVSLEGDRVVLPVRLLNDVIPMVEVQIGGKMYWFIVDTCFNMPVALSKKLEFDVVKVSSGPELPVSGSTEGITVAKSYYINEIKLNKVSFYNLFTVIMDLTLLTEQTGIELGGIIGFPTFKNILFTLDYPNKSLVLWKGSLPSPDQEKTFELVIDKGYPKFSLECAGKKIYTYIDTGSGGYLAIPEIERNEYSFLSQPLITGLYVGITGMTSEISARLKGDIRIGLQTINKPIVNIWENGYYVIGGKILTNFIVTFDQKNSIVRLERSEKNPIEVPCYKNLGFQTVKKNGFYTVINILPGSGEGFPIIVGDVILLIDGRDISSLDKGEIIKSINASNFVKLVIKRGSKRLDVTVPVQVLVP